MHARECGEHVWALLKQVVLLEGVGLQNRPSVLHLDNGSPMESVTPLETPRFLGVQPSHSRPLVSNDNAFVESAFRTCKYRPDYSAAGFGTMEDARNWVWLFVEWYNTKYRHSRLKFVTPQQRHTKEAPAIMRRRVAVYEAARASDPRRWSRAIRYWSLPLSVWLNPVKKAKPEIA